MMTNTVAMITAFSLIGVSLKSPVEESAFEPSEIIQISHFDLFLPLGSWFTSKTLQCTVSVFIIVELARGHRWNRNLEPNFCPGRYLNPEPLDWQLSMLTTRPPCTPVLRNASKL